MKSDDLQILLPSAVTSNVTSSHSISFTDIGRLGIITGAEQFESNNASIDSLNISTVATRAVVMGQSKSK